jgi:dihydrofolate reductase
MRINLIYAQAANGVIGRDHAMPWHLPEDLAYFKQHTRGYPVIMGRATWESLPARMRPLPERLNIVLTRQPDTAVRLTEQGALAMGGLPEALAHCQQLPEAPAEVWIMGGAQIYAQALPWAQRALVTEIHQPFEGDAYAPTLDPTWRETARTESVSRSGLRFAFVVYEKSPAPGASHSG